MMYCIFRSHDKNYSRHISTSLPESEKLNAAIENKTREVRQRNMLDLWSHEQMESYKYCVMCGYKLKR